MATVAEQRMAEADRYAAEVRARIQAETHRLDREDEITAQMEADFRASLVAMQAETRRMRIKAAMDAAAGEREGWPATWDYQAVLDEYGIDEYGQPIPDTRTSSED